MSILFIYILILSCSLTLKKNDTGYTVITPDYHTVYDLSQVNSIYIKFSAVSWDALLKSPKSYTKADVRFNGKTWTDTGVRCKGNSSFHGVDSSKKSIKIDFEQYKDNNLFYGLKKLVLNNGYHDPSMLRECLVLKIFSNAGVPAPRCNYLKLHVDRGDSTGYQYHGLYINIEQVDKRFLRDRFSYENAHGNLYKPEGRYSDLSIFDKNVLQKRTNEKEANWTDINRLITILQNSTEAEDIKNNLEPIFNIDSFLRYIALNNILTNWDSYSGSTKHNYYIYNNPNNPVYPENDYWEIIVWDVNESFGNFPRRITAEQMISWPWTNVSTETGINTPILIDRIMKVSEWKEKYKFYIRKFISINGAFNEEEQLNRSQYLHGLIDSAVSDDPNFLYLYTDFLDNYENDLLIDLKVGLGIRRYIRDRIAFLNNDLENDYSAE